MPLGENRDSLTDKNGVKVVITSHPGAPFIFMKTLNREVRMSVVVPFDNTTEVKVR
jgi:hypothetical protein